MVYTAAAALAGGELIGGRKIAGRERLAEQADGVVGLALFRRRIRRLEIVEAAGLHGCGKQHQAHRRNKTLIMTTPVTTFSPV